MSLDEHEAPERAQQVALFRYQLICPALEPGLSTKARGRVVRAIAARTHAGPFGGQHRYPATRWTAGSAATAPAGSTRWRRRPAAARQPHRHHGAGAGGGAEAGEPDRTAAQVVRILRASAGWAPSESTLLRLFHRRELMGPAAGRPAGGVRPVRGRDTERTLGR